VKINITRTSNDVKIPKYESKGAAGFDLCAATDEIVAPESRTLVSTGLRMAIPVGYELQIRPRSGLALKKGITVLNSPGTVDSDYRGDVGIILINHGSEDFIIKKGDRIAQGVVQAVTQAMFEIVEELDETERGTGGFGSTGHK